MRNKFLCLHLSNWNFPSLGHHQNPLSKHPFLSQFLMTTGNIWKIEMRVKAEKYKLDLKKIESERNQQRNLTIFMILLLVIGIISAFLVFKRFNKDNHIITYQKEIRCQYSN